MFIKIHYLLTITVLTSLNGTNTKGRYLSAATIIPAVNVTKKDALEQVAQAYADNKRDSWEMKFKLA